MLTHLHIRDFAIVAELSLELHPGMTVLTGETGAGKSILVDALDLVLGERAAASLVRPGAERAEVVATFDTRGVPQVQAQLRELELDSPEEVCILRRTVGTDGRSRAFLNGRPMPVQGLRELGELLVDIHGQHAHQALQRREAQREVLDHFAGHADLLATVREVHQGWGSTRAAIARLGGSSAEQAAVRELLAHEVGELRGLALQPGEVEALDEEHRRLSHAGALLASARRALEELEEAEEGPVVARLDGLSREIEEMARFDPRARSIEELLEGAVIQAREAAGALRRYAEGVDLDPERLAWLEDRVAAVESLARKHRVTARELPDHQARLEARLAEIEQGDERLAALETELEPLERRYAELVARLHAGRLEAAPRLARAIEANARPLGMADARVDVQVQPTPAEVPTPHGRDRIEFLFSANPGQPLAPLGQVASGGELSRVSLAIQLIGARGRGVPTQIFDEVDAGVGGRVADAVGQALRQLAGSCQVLCVTHLPQVAAQGQQHLEVSKAARDGHTFAHVALLGAEARVRELARMLGGAKITARALDHAREMLERPEVRARRGAGLGRPGR